MYLALSLWSKGSISVGTLVLAQLVFANIFAHLWGLGRSISKFTEALADASEMIDIIERPIEVKDLTTSQTPAIKAGAIEFNKVNFYYHPTNPVFTDFNLTIPAGQKVGLVGSSGCGKSTLVKLILRFVDVQSGEIAIDGQRIDSITQDDLRQNIAYVPQDPSLFHRSLLENIKYGNEEATMEDVIEAAKKAYAHDFISQLPQGYDTLVGERGVKLSGGERQRVAIARAILKRAPIIILDEATSSLDTESEGFIKEAFDSLIKGRTTIVIAHRLSTIQKMDRIIVMDKGKIVEDGNHQELIKNEEIYHRFWQYQISE
ncbi:MAG: ABC transporter ATP-binding protein/permease [Candidatus Vogelbacteria bacterium]|nr:ABC transporter ATP-binding protein/permease [Candidatus Vogelbacteria bacterium]